MHAHDLIAIAGVLVAGFVCHWLSWRTRIPAILFLLLTGIAVGPLLGWLNTDALLGSLLIPTISLAVAIILFEGSLTLRVSDIRGHGGVVARLVTIGVLVTWLSGILPSYFFLDWEPHLAALFGAIVTVSGPTVVMPLLRSVRPSPAVSQVLRWEAILIDPLGAVLALLTFDFIIATQIADGLSSSLRIVGTIVFFGAFLGCIAGYAFGVAIRRRWVPDFLRDYAALAAVLTVFAAAEAIHSETGLLAVTVMGIWLANSRNLDLDDVLSFKESLTLLLVAALFILLAARLDLQAMIALGGGAVLIVIVLQLIAGPLRALVCAAGSSLSLRERLFLGWVFPRGIVAAAISAFFALRLEDKGFESAEWLVPMVFAVIFGTVLIQSVATRWVARLLGVAAPERTGVLVLGANELARTYAKSLQDAGLPVLVADSHWTSVRDARMDGLRVFYGNVMSSYADNNVDYSELGTLLAVSRQPGLNELACVRLAREFGRDSVYTMRHDVESGHEKHKVSGEGRGRLVFGGDHTIDDLATLVVEGWSPKRTKITSDFSFDDYLRKSADSVVMFAIDEDNKVHFPVDDSTLDPAEGWTVSALIPPKTQS